MTAATNGQSDLGELIDGHSSRTISVEAFEHIPQPMKLIGGEMHRHLMTNSALETVLLSVLLEVFDNRLVEWSFSKRLAVLDPWVSQCLNTIRHYSQVIGAALSARGLIDSLGNEIMHTPPLTSVKSQVK
jgi:hypothetical protein